MKKFLILIIAISSILLVSCGGSDGVNCKNECDTNGTTRCTADGQNFETCTLQPNQCNIWVKTDCTGGEVCVNANSIAGCGTAGNNVITDCTEGGNECAANSATGQTECVNNKCVIPSSNGNVTDCTNDSDCANNTNGNTVCKDDDSCGTPTSTTCSSNSDCTSGKVCNNGSCIDGIKNGDTCDVNGRTKCKDTSTVFVCTLQSDTSLEWEEDNCGAGQCITDPTTNVDACTD